MDMDVLAFEDRDMGGGYVISFLLQAMDASPIGYPLSPPQLH